jgi:hypothetical protein
MYSSRVPLGTNSEEVAKKAHWEDHLSDLSNPFYPEMKPRANICTLGLDRNPDSRSIELWYNLDEEQNLGIKEWHRIDGEWKLVRDGEPER